MVKIRFEFTRLNANLQLLGQRMQRTVLREGLRDAAEPLRRRMSQLAPIDPESTKHLKHQIAIGNALGLDRQEVAVAVGPTRQSYYGSFQELGTSFMAPQPFARPAFDEMWMACLKLFSESIWRELKIRIGRGPIVTTSSISVPIEGGPGGGGLV